MIQTKNIRLGSLTLRYAESPGPSPPILFLHGVTDSLDSYLAPMAGLGDRFRLVALDFRGHGGSGHVAGRYRIRDHAEDVQRFTETVIGEPVLLAGHSLGGLVATFMAAFVSTLARGAFLEDPPLYAAAMPRMKAGPEYQIFLGLRELLRHHGESGQSVETLAALVGAWPIHPMLFEGRSLLEVAGAEVVRQRAESLHRLDVGVLDPVLDGSQLDGFDVDQDLGRIRCPLHVLAGQVALGGTMDQRDLHRLKAGVPHASCTVLPDVGHFIHHTAPAAYIEQVLGFAASVCAEAHAPATTADRTASTNRSG